MINVSLYSILRYFAQVTVIIAPWRTRTVGPTARIRNFREGAQLQGANLCLRLKNCKVDPFLDNQAVSAMQCLIDIIHKRANSPRKEGQIYAANFR